MSISLGTKQVTNSYEESQEERTKEIRIRIPKGEQPEIMITREILTYHDGVLVSTATSKVFRITLEDLALANKTTIMQDIADAIDAIAPTK